MNAQETLAQIDHMMTEIDLALYQWQTDLDMMSFIGQDYPLRLWTNDDPPMIMTLAEAPNLLKNDYREVRVMQRQDGVWTKVGTAQLNPMSGRLIANIEDEEVVKKIQGPIPAMSFGDRSTYFNVDEDGEFRRLLPLNPPFEGLNKPLTIRGLEEAIAKEEKQREGRQSWLDDLSKKVNDKINRDFIYTEQNLWPADDEELNNHPFFIKDLWSDKKEN